MRTSIAVLVLALVGCSGGAATDIEPTLVFADRSDAELVRLINAAGGTEIFMAEAQLSRFGDTSTGDPCPAVAIDGSSATITGGCTTADGVMIDGTAIVTNPFGWDQIQYDYSNPTVYEAQAFTLGYGSGAPSQIYDGTMQRIDSLTGYDADITVTQSGAALRSDLLYRCSNPSNPSCTVNGGLELVDVGGAVVTGTIALDATTRRQTLDFTLQGVDRLTVHSDGTCVAWSIEGTDRGMTCP